MRGDPRRVLFLDVSLIWDSIFACCFCSGVFVSTAEVLDYNNFTSKLSYNMCEMVLNECRLNGRSDCSWRAHLGLKEDIRGCSAHHRQQGW